MTTEAGGIHPTGMHSCFMENHVVLPGVSFWLDPVNKAILFKVTSDNAVNRFVCATTTKNSSEVKLYMMPHTGTSMDSDKCDYIKSF